MHTRYMELDDIEAASVEEARNENQYLMVLDRYELAILAKYVNETEQARAAAIGPIECQHDWLALTSNGEFHQGCTLIYRCNKCGKNSIWG